MIKFITVMTPELTVLTEKIHGKPAKAQVTFGSAVCVTEYPEGAVEAALPVVAVHVYNKPLFTT